MQNLRKYLNKENIFKFITTLLVCLSPLLSIYRCCVYFTLCEVLFIGLILVLLIFNRPKDFIQPKLILVIVIYIIYISVMGVFGYILWGNFSLNIFSRLCRFVFYIFNVVFLGRYYFDFKLAKFLIKIIIVSSTVFLFLQLLYHYITGDFIYFVVKEWIYSSVYDDGYYKLLESITPFRGAGIFLEPAHYSQYMLISIAIIMFSSKMKWYDWIIVIFSTIGIMLCLSLTGIFVSVFIWVMYACILSFNTIKKDKRHLWWIMAVFLLICCCFVLIFRNQISHAVARLFGIGTSSTAWSKRMASYIEIFETGNLWKILFGNGWGVLTSGVFYSSVSYVINSTGILGLLGMFAFWIFMLYYFNKKQRLCFIIFIILNFVTEVGISCWLIYILTVILNIKNETNKKSEIKGDYL